MSEWRNEWLNEWMKNVWMDVEIKNFKFQNLSAFSGLEIQNVKLEN